MVNHNVQARVDGLKDSANWTLVQPGRRWWWHLVSSVFAEVAHAEGEGWDL